MSINPVQRTPLESTPNLAVRQVSRSPAQIPDVLITSSSSCTQWVRNIGNQISDFIQKIFTWIGSLIERTPLTHSSPISLDPSQHAHQISNANKLYVYNQLLQGRDIGNDSIIAQKFSLDAPQAVEPLPLFGPSNPHISVTNGSFLYDSSTANTVHWTANFADANLFGFCEGPLLAQDELQVLEHPALAHIKSAFPMDLRTLGTHEIALFQNVPRLGSLDTSTPLPNGQTLYGNYFAQATTAEIHSKLTRFASPTKSNLFAMAAPRIPLSQSGQPYQKSDLAKLFFTAYNAFRSIKEVSGGKRVVVHTGNWGAGAFGNDPKTVHLIQLAAAHLAGIDEFRMHPMSQAGAFQSAKQLLENIRTQSPQMTSGQFLDHLTANAPAYNLRYGQGNGT